MTRWKPIVIALTALLLAGCITPEGIAAGSAIAERGAAAYDQGLENNIWFICKAASVGSVQRRFGISTEKAEAWRTLCVTDPQASVIGP